MKRFLFIVFGFGGWALALVLALTMAIRSPKARELAVSPTESETKVKARTAAPTFDPEMADTTFYIFENGNFSDPRQGEQFFGAMNKIGVPKSIMEALPGHQADFEWIRDRTGDRVAYLQGNGHVFRDPNNKWRIQVTDFGVVAGAKRIVAYADLGKNMSHPWGIYCENETSMIEIWEIRNGQSPLLLERQHGDIPSGVHTQAEVNTHVVVPVSPPGTIGY